MSKKLKITLTKSISGRKPGHKETVLCLGLRKIRQTVTKDVTPELLGMVRQVSYLLDVQECE